MFGLLFPGDDDWKTAGGAGHAPDSTMLPARVCDWSRKRCSGDSFDGRKTLLSATTAFSASVLPSFELGLSYIRQTETEVFVPFLMPPWPSGLRPLPSKFTLKAENRGFDPRRGLILFWTKYFLSIASLGEYRDPSRRALVIEIAWRSPRSVLPPSSATAVRGARALYRSA